MRLRDDERAQSVQIGAVLLFAVLVIAFSSYQAFVVPNQNRAVEFNHNQQIRNQMQDLRNEIVSIHGETATQSVTLTLGTRYPSRLVAVNPGPPSGTIRTVGTGPERVNLTVANAEASGETGDFWTGVDNRSYNTGGIVYQPNYNVYGQAPLTIYENTVLYNQFRESNLTASDQTLIVDERISVVTVNGSLSTTRTGSTSLDLRPVSTSTTTVPVTNASATENVTLAVATQLPESQWGTLLEGQFDENGGHVVDYGVEPIDGSPFDRLWIELEPGVTYRLRMTKVGVGTGVTEEGSAYLTDVAGNGTRLDVDDSATVTLEVRDAYNNPVSGVAINVSAEKGSLSPQQAVTDDAGEATFTYSSSGVSGGQWVDLDFSTATDPGSTFDATTPENVTMQLWVQRPPNGGGGGNETLDVSWANPEALPANDGAAVSDCSPERCRWDVGASDDRTLRLNATTAPAFDGVVADFAVNDSTVGTISPGEDATGASGIASTELTASANGSIAIAVTGGDGGDVIDLRVVNVSGPSGPTLTTRVDDLTDLAEDQPVFLASYNVSNTNSSFQRVDVTFENVDDSSATRTSSSTATLAGLAYQNNYGSTNGYEITYDVIYSIDGTERVVASETISETPDARNPGGNANLATGTSAQLTSWRIEDRSTNGQGPRYDFSYQVSSGSFSEVQIGVLNLPGSGSTAVQTSTSRSGSGVTVNPPSGYQDDYRLVILVRNANGAVVDVVSIQDAADGTGVFQGP